MKLKKLAAVLMVAIMLTLVTSEAVHAGSGRGGPMGFIAGCCFGMRAGAAYNEGKDIHWREWVMLLPYVNFVFALWNGIDGYSGVTTADYAEQYGASFF